MPSELTELNLSRHRLGSLCKRGHDWQNTGKSARFIHNNLCIVCKRHSHTSRMNADPDYTVRKKALNKAAVATRSLSEEGRQQLVRAQVKHWKKKNEQDPYFALVARLRSRVRRAFNYHLQHGKLLTSKQYGIDYAAIIEHIGPCPGDRKHYHVDHIKPLAAFDLRDLEQVKLAFAPENHQWLTVAENLAKKDKLPNGPP